MSSKCDFCQKTVYFAEKQTRKGLDYHGSCLQKKILEEKIKRVSLRGGLIKKETITQEQLSVVSNVAQNLTQKGNEQVKEENKKKWQELRKNKQNQSNGGNHTRDINIPLKSVLEKAPTNNHHNGESDQPENCPHDVFSSNQKYFHKPGTNNTEQNGEGPKKRVVVRKVIIKKVVKKTDKNSNNTENNESTTNNNTQENNVSSKNTQPTTTSSTTENTNEDPLERRMRERREQKERQKLEEQRKKEELELKLQELQNKMNSIPEGVGTVELEDDPIGDDDPIDDEPIDDEPIGDDEPLDEEPLDEEPIEDGPIDDNLDGEGFDDVEDFGDDGEGLSFCPECGNKQSDPTAKFCEDCGNPLELEDV